jgi:hypothetical protein
MTARFYILTALTALSLNFLPLNARCNLPAKGVAGWAYDVAANKLTERSSQAANEFLKVALPEYLGLAALTFANPVSATTTLEITPESSPLEKFLAGFNIGMDLKSWEPESLNYNQLINIVASRISSATSEMIDKVIRRSEGSVEELLDAYTAQIYILSGLLDHILHTGLRKEDVSAVRLLETFYSMAVILENVTNHHSIYYQGEVPALEEFVFGISRHDFSFNNTLTQETRQDFLRIYEKIADNPGIKEDYPQETAILEEVYNFLDGRERLLEEAVNADGPNRYFLNLVETQMIINAGHALNRIGEGGFYDISALSSEDIYPIEIAYTLFISAVEGIQKADFTMMKEISEIPGRLKQALVLIYKRLESQDVVDNAGILTELVYMINLLELRFSGRVQLTGLRKALKDPVAYLRRAEEWLNTNTYWRIDNTNLPPGRKGITFYLYP